MPRYETPGDGSDAITSRNGDAAPRIVIAVVRTGGIAGLRRRWRVEREPEEAPEWVALVERCPWDQRMDAGEQTGADRYVWSIHAVLPDEQREQVVPDALLQGAWRELVDAVRAADSD
ncbi:protealysin inhibitor emfourin [Microbacterium sp.]|jgi:hypothetical protein|uniref:protealysin inhibitor emfourin n=1 Tax=Microbacterium sp. TaxID=51671 RepID=UPI003C74C0F8